MEIPIELFLGGIAVSIAIGIFGFIRNPQIPAMLCFGGAFVLLLSVSTTAILMDAFSSGTTNNLYHYNVESATGNININAGGTTIRTEFASASNSALVGDTINCIDAYFGKTGSPTGLVDFGTFDSVSGAVIIEFGTIDLSSVGGAQQWHTACLTGDNTYTIQSGDRIGIRYDEGDGSNLITQRSNGNNPFDGTISFLSSFTAGAWVSATTNDPTMRFYLAGGDFQITQDPYEFTELPKTFFALIGGTMILLGALMVIKE